MATDAHSKSITMINVEYCECDIDNKKVSPNKYVNLGGKQDKDENDNYTNYLKKSSENNSWQKFSDKMHEKKCLEENSKNDKLFISKAFDKSNNCQNNSHKFSEEDDTSSSNSFKSKRYNNKNYYEYVN